MKAEHPFKNIRTSCAQALYPAHYAVHAATLAADRIHCAMALHGVVTCQLTSLQSWVPPAKAFLATIPASPFQALLRQQSARMFRGRAVAARAGICYCLKLASTSLAE